MVRWLGAVQVRIKSQKYSELDVGGRETYLSLLLSKILF